MQPRTGTERLGILTTAVVFAPWCLALFYLSARRIFWCDELLLVSLIQSASLSDILPALRQGADGGFPLPYFVFKLWSSLSGFSELALRVPSILCGLLASVAIYVACRTTLRHREALFCVIVSTFGSTMLLRHATEVRFYGLFYCSAALLWAALAKMQKSSVGNRLRVQWGWFALAVGGNVALICSHQFGILYSGIFFLFAVWGTPARGVGKLWQAAKPFFLGWVVFLLYLPSALEQRQSLIGDSELYSAPVILTLLKIYLQLLPGFSYEGWPDETWYKQISLTLTVLLWISLVLLGLTSRSKTGSYAGKFTAVQRPSANFGLALMLLVVPLLFGTAACFGQSLLLYRYLLPSQLGFVVLLSALLGSAQPLKCPNLLVAVGGGIMLWGVAGLAAIPTRAAQLNNAFSDPMPTLPLVSTSLSEFYHYRHYRPQREVYYLSDYGLGHAMASSFNQAPAEQSIQAARHKRLITDGIVSLAELKKLSDDFIVSLFNREAVEYVKKQAAGRFVVKEDTDTFNIRLTPK